MSTPTAAGCARTIAARKRLRCRCQSAIGSGNAAALFSSMPTTTTSFSGGSDGRCPRRRNSRSRIARSRRSVGPLAATARQRPRIAGKRAARIFCGRLWCKLSFDADQGPGIYALWEDDELIYLGRASATATIRERLNEHLTRSVCPGAENATHYRWELALGMAEEVTPAQEGVQFTKLRPDGVPACVE